MYAWVALFVGFALIALVLQDAFEVMLLPRRVQRPLRLVRFYFHSTWTAWRALACRMPPGAARERFLGVYGPLSMVALFSLWALMLIVGFGGVQWALHVFGRVPVTLDGMVYMSGSTFFTLGYGDIVPKTTPARVGVVIEAGLGLGFLAVVIGYLPVLYQLFSRREAHVIQLDGRAGSPPTAATLIRRHAESGGLDRLDDLLGAWENWGAELLESHLSYPMLAFYRSQHDDHSWLGGLAAIMDVCALVLVGATGLKPLQARMTFAMARHVIVEMSRSLHAGPAKPSQDRLPHDAFIAMEAQFREAGLDWTGGAEAEETLADLRATYEPMLRQLADHLLIPLPGWISGGDDGPDHWEQGRRGSIASRLVEELAAQNTQVETLKARAALTPAGRLRARLKRGKS